MLSRICLILVVLFAGCFQPLALAGAPADDDTLATYESEVIAVKKGKLLAFYNSLSAPVDRESLEAMAWHCYEQGNGKQYERVMISWYLPGQKKGEKPWAVSNFSKTKQVIEILDEAAANRFPAVKRWNQQGHKPVY